MKTFGKIIICIIVILAAIGIAYLIYNGEEKATNGNAIANTNTATNSQNTNNNLVENEVTNQIDTENTDYIGEEENKEDEPVQDEEQEDEQEATEPEQQEQPLELTGKDKAIDIVKKQYAMDGQTVRFDHMEGTDYVIKLNDGTAVTWYLVDGTTWEAEEY